MASTKKSNNEASAADSTGNLSRMKYNLDIDEETGLRIRLGETDVSCHLPFISSSYAYTVYTYVYIYIYTYPYITYIHTYIHMRDMML